MAVTDDGAFSEICRVAIQKKGGAYGQYAAYIEEFDPSAGDKDGSSVPMVNGGRVWKKTPEGDSEITMKLYPIGIGTSESLVQLYNGTTDSAEPLESTNSHVRDLFRVVFLWTDDTTNTTANGSTAAATNSYRLYFDAARMTSCKEKYGDLTLTNEVTFKVPAFTQTGTGNIVRQSGKATALVALSDYT